MDLFLQYLLSPLVIVAIGKWLDFKLDKHKKEREREKAVELAKEQEMTATMELMKMGLMAMLRDRILQSCNYYIGKGSITALALENITRMHDSYKALGGNGLCDHQYDAIQNLPLEE